MAKRSILLYWLLILIPAIIISSAAYRLLYHEQERINRLSVSAVEDRARVIGESIQVTIDAVQDELTRSLLDIYEDNIQATLLDWEENNPLVRNVFIWDKGRGLLYPEKGLVSTSEERNFISRFEGLFSGRIPWPSLNRDITGEQESSLVQDIIKIKSSKNELLKIAQSNSYRETKAAGVQEEATSSGGWVPWFAENKLYILGWVKKNEDAPVYGVELELMTLLSRLINNFPQARDGQSAYAIIDDSGRLLHQAGDMIIGQDIKPLLSVPLAPYLPHWAIAVYTDGQDISTGSGNEFMIIACLLLFIFIAAIASGGFLLMRHAKQNMVDAQQKTSFVSNVSHELKTPLTSIRMFAELLLDGRVNDQDKKNKYLGIIVSESRRLTRLVNNVLDFSRIEQCKKTYNMEEIELVPLLLETFEFNKPRIKDAGMESHLNIPDESITVKTDRDAMEQVILNVMDNAIKYASTGGEISLFSKAGERAVEIRIEDRGPGVPEKDRNKIFEKFHRVDTSLTATKQGSGLGLSIARRILEDMGGSLSYAPRQGGGSCFTVKVPMDPDKHKQ